MKLNGSAADAHATVAPIIAVPEALTLPVAGRTRRIAASGIGRPVRSRSVVPGSIVPGPIVIGARRDCAADNGAAEQSGGNTDPDATLRMGRRGRRDGRDGQGGGGSKCYQCFPHGITFPRSRSHVPDLTTPRRLKRDSRTSVRLWQSSTFHLNDQ